MATATALAIPGLNIVVAGAMVSILAGLGAGATTGGLVGALVGSGIHDDEAEIIEEEIGKGGYLIAVHYEKPNQETQIREILSQ
jgi:hypothetical protein